MRSSAGSNGKREDYNSSSPGIVLRKFSARLTTLGHLGAIFFQLWVTVLSQGLLMTLGSYGTGPSFTPLPGTFFYALGSFEPRDVDAAHENSSPIDVATLLASTSSC